MAAAMAVFVMMRAVMPFTVMMTAVMAFAVVIAVHIGIVVQLIGKKGVHRRVCIPRNAAINRDARLT